MKNSGIIAALGLVTAACGGSANPHQAAQNDPMMEQPELMASAAAPDGVAPVGAVDVLQREGCRVDPAARQASALGTNSAQDQTG